MRAFPACVVLLATLSPGPFAQDVLSGFDRPEHVFSGSAVIDSEVRDTGVPLGGIGTGRFDLCTDGSFRHVTLGPVQPPVARLAGSYLELDASVSGASGVSSDPQRRALVLGGAGGLPGIARLRYRGIFPRLFIEASDPGLPVRAELEAWTPFVPHDAEASSLPAAAFDVLLTNTSASSATACIALVWPADPQLPTTLVLEAAADADGRIERADGRVAVSFDLAPGATGRATLVVAWDAPQHRSRQALPGGAVDAAHRLLERHDELKSRTRAWQALLFDSDLPEWYAERLCNDLIPLVTSTRLPAEGPFAIAESAAGLGGILGTLDQRLIAHVATQAFFPELDREELAHFAARQRPDGELAHHLGSLDGTLAEDQGFLGWPDLAASFICQVWQHERWTGDAAFTEAMAGPVTSALRWLLARDTDGDGIFDGGSTFDYRPRAQGFVYTASIGLAALEAGRRFAEERGDGELAAACAAGAERARAALVGRLWNGRWFARSLDATGVEESSDCFLGQLAGEWYAGTMGWPSLVPAALRDRALESLMALNGAASSFLPPLDVRADGSVSSTRWGWLPHVWAFYAAPLIDSGRTDAALQCLQRTDRMLVDQARDPWRVGLYYDCKTGLNPKPDYDWYMSMPASWWTLASLSGVALDVPAGELRLEPRPPAARSDFSLPVFTPVLTARLAVHELEFGIQRTLVLSVLGVHGSRPLPVRRLVVLMPPVDDPEALVVTAARDGAPLPGTAHVSEGQLVLELDEPLVLEAGTTLTVVVGDPKTAAFGLAVAERRAAATAVLENEAIRVELQRDERGLRRLTIGDRQHGGEARFDVTDLFRIELPATENGKAFELLTNPARTRGVHVLSATHTLSADESGQLWTLEQELELRWPGRPDRSTVSVRTEVRLPAGRQALLLSLRLRGDGLASLGRAGGPVRADFPRLELLDPERVGDPLVVRAGETSFLDAARVADWTGAWSVGPEGETIAIAGPVPDLHLRWVEGDGTAHCIVLRADGQQHLKLEPAFILEPGAQQDGWWISGGALEIALR